MHKGTRAKLEVRRVLVNALAVIRAAGDVETIDEAWTLEKRFRAEMAELEKEVVQTELELTGEAHKTAA